MSSQRQTQLWVALTVASAGAALFWWHCRQRRTKDEKTPTSASGEEKSAATADASVDPAIVEAFRQASARVRKLPSESLSNREKLILYGLFKQATEGDAGPFRMNVSWNLLEAQAKHHAWSQFRTMPTETAMLHYLKAVEDIETNENRPNPDEDEEPMGFGNAVSMPAMEENGGHDDEEDGKEVSPGKRLLRAAGSNDVKTLELVLDSGEVNADHEDESGQTALHLAADKAAKACVESLLQHGANPSAADQDGISVLQAAVIAGNVDTVELLLQHGADPDQADCDGDTPRSCAADDGSPEMKQLFGFEDLN